MPDERAHEPGRFARAFSLAKKGLVEQIGPTQYTVQGRHKRVYHVDLAGDPPCYCEDQEWAGQKIRNNCKHVLAAKILAKHPSIVESLMEFAYQQQQAVQSLERTTRRKSA